MSDNSGLIADALLKTDPALYAAIDGGNSWKAVVAQRGARVKLFRNYERGDHRADMTTQMKAMLRITSDTADLSDLNDNYCGIIADKFSSRVSVSELSTGDDKVDENWLQPLLDSQDFDAAEGMWWRGAIIDGDAFVMVDPITFLWTSEPAFDGFSGMVVIYNQLTRKPAWACKVWSESDSEDQGTDDVKISQPMRIVVYQPKKISYFKGEDGGQEVVAWEQDKIWEKSQDEKQKNVKAWPDEMNGSFPFVTFANNKNNYTRYGESELRKAIPLQDVLNRTIYSMVMASEFAAFMVSYSIGMEIDAKGVVPGGVVNLTLKTADGTVVTEFTEDQIEFLKACKVGQLEATDISQYTNQIQMIVKEISQATQTPIYGITASGVISGDALKQLEIGLIGKVKRFQRQNTDSLKELIMLTAKMQRVFSPGKNPPEIKTVNVTWKSPELLDTDAQVATLVKMRKDAPNLWPDTFYRQKIGQLLGMSKTDITTEEGLIEKQQELEAVDMIGGSNGAEPTGGDATIERETENGIRNQ